MPRLLPQFLFPVWLFVFVVLAVALGIGGAAVAVGALLIALVIWRIRDMKSHPGSGELTTEPFWRFWEHRRNW